MTIGCAVDWTSGYRTRPLWRSTSKIGSVSYLTWNTTWSCTTSPPPILGDKPTGNPQAQRGCSRDRRSDCKQICIGLVAGRSGMPFGLEVFAGNRTDVTTVLQIVQTMESRYGQANRIWVMDRGMVRDDQMTFLRREGRRYIVGTPPSMLKEYEQALLSGDWPLVRESLQVKLVDGLEGDKTFILCRSQDRHEKEKAMHDRFEQ